MQITEQAQCRSQPRTLTIHIGLPKTGTTFFQKVLLPALVPVTAVLPGQSILSLANRPLQNATLLSDEGLSGRPFGGQWSKDFESNLDMLKDLFREAQIMIGFRKHDAFMMSLYKQYLHEGGTEAFEYLFDPHAESLITIDDLLFEGCIARVNERFERVFVYTQEQLRDDMSGFVERLSAFLGVTQEVPKRLKQRGGSNIGLKGQRQAQLLIALNTLNSRLERTHPRLSLNNRLLCRLRLTPRQLCQDRLNRLPTRPLRPPPEIQRFLEEHYRDDWRFVQKLASRTC